MRRRIRRATLGKTAIKHSRSKVANIGQGTVVITPMTIATTNVGTRIASGATTVLQDASDTAQTVMVGTVIKYVNICIQCGPRWVTGDVPTADDNGWLEYVIVKNKTTQLAPATTNLGTKTLADICTTNFRGDVLFTGCMPIGAQQPSSLDLKIKLPKQFCKFQWGSVLTLFCQFRSVSSTDVRTDSHRLVTSTLFKGYN